jgi:hypothetical protein
LRYHCAGTRGVVASGAYSGAFVIDAMQHAAIHFRPGGAPAILGLPASELTNTHLDLTAFWARRSDRAQGAALRGSKFARALSVDGRGAHRAAAITAAPSGDPCRTRVIRRSGRRVVRSRRRPKRGPQPAALHYGLHVGCGSHGQAVLPHPPIPARPRAHASTWKRGVGPVGPRLTEILRTQRARVLQNKTQTRHGTTLSLGSSRQVVVGVGGADRDRTGDLVNAILLASGLRPPTDHFQQQPIGRQARSRLLHG